MLEIKSRYLEMYRNIGVDVIRTIAIIFVLGTHAIGFSPSGLIQGIGDFVLIYLRIVFLTCVPLFMILSGYLNWKKTIRLIFTKNGYQDWYLRISFGEQFP